MRGDEHPSQERRLDNSQGQIIKFCQKVCGNCGITESFKCNYADCVDALGEGTCRGQALTKDLFCQEVTAYCKLAADYYCRGPDALVGFGSTAVDWCVEDKLGCVASCTEDL